MIRRRTTAGAQADVGAVGRSRRPRVTDTSATLAALRPWAAPGRLVNFLGDVSGPAEVAAAYPPAVRERLLALKAAVDPGDVSSFGYALSPRG